MHSIIRGLKRMVLRRYEYMVDNIPLCPNMSVPTTISRQSVRGQFISFGWPWAVEAETEPSRHQSPLKEVLLSSAPQTPLRP